MFKSTMLALAVCSLGLAIPATARAAVTAPTLTLSSQSGPLTGESVDFQIAGDASLKYQVIVQSYYTKVPGGTIAYPTPVLSLASGKLDAAGTASFRKKLSGSAQVKVIVYTPCVWDPVEKKWVAGATVTYYSTSAAC